MTLLKEAAMSEREDAAKGRTSGIRVSSFHVYSPGFWLKRPKNASLDALPAGAQAEENWAMLLCWLTSGRLTIAIDFARSTSTARRVRSMRICGTYPTHQAMLKNEAVFWGQIGASSRKRMVGEVAATSQQNQSLSPDDIKKNLSHSKPELFMRWKVRLGHLDMPR